MALGPVSILTTGHRETPALARSVIWGTRVRGNERAETPQSIMRLGIKGYGCSYQHIRSRPEQSYNENCLIRELLIWS